MRRERKQIELRDVSQKFAKQVRGDGAQNEGKRMSLMDGLFTSINFSFTVTHHDY